MNREYFALIARIVGYTTLGKEVLKMASGDVSNGCRNELLEIAKYLSLKASRAEADLRSIEERMEYLNNKN